MTPSDEYRQRLAARRELVERIRKLDRLVAHLRLVAGLSFVILLWLAAGRHVLSGWWAGLAFAAFLGLMAYHEKVLARGRRAVRSVAFYEAGVARIEDRWIGSGDSRSWLAPENHLYAADLDIFGKGSLFELLNTARTRSGAETLASWLCAPAEREEILRRQEAVDELRNNIDLREDLAILGADAAAAVHPEIIKNWAALPVILESAAARMIAPVLSLITIVACVDYELSSHSGWIALAAIAVQSAFGLYYQNRVRAVIAGVEQPGKDLEILSLVLARLEQEQFTSARLRAIRESLETGGAPASSEIAHVELLIELLNYRLNAVFALASSPFFFATQLCFAIESWRHRNAPAIGGWLNAVGEMEALCALAGYAYEHPDDPFPEIAETGPRFEAEAMRHPLLPASRCVPNSVRLDSGLRMVVVSGSNMSGKSTLLRTAGVNVLLALAGAPVRAQRIRLSPLQIGATIRVMDSLQAGTSRFYAEIQRMHDIMESTKGPLPVLFLLDEILHGTNSHDRAIGAEAVLRGLIDRGAVGLVTTHDLALAKVADALAPQAANAHFEDHLENGKMVFDYQLRPGVVQKSNALELMRAVGLDV